MRLRPVARIFLKLYLVRVIAAFVVHHAGKLSPLAQRIGARFQVIQERWRRLPHGRRHFLLNLLIGTIIAVALHFAHHTSLVKETENIAIDAMMGVNQRLQRMTGTHHGRPLRFAFIDIDENTYRVWDEPFFTPRDKLLRLVRFAAEGGAKVVVVNVDLSIASNTDAKLLNYLENYQGRNRPPLALIRSFFPPSDYTNKSEYEIRPSILDTIALSDRILQTLPLFRRSHYDGTVRYWHLWRIGCLEGQPFVLPSIQLALDALLTTASDENDPLDQIRRLTPSNCSAIGLNEDKHPTVLRHGQIRIDLSHDPIGERLIYTLPWQGGETTDLVTISAWSISETDYVPATDLVRDRIVVIGASFADSRDIYPTPIGEMPGALVVLNAIKSLHLFGQIKAPSLAFKGFIELALIVLMAWAYARLGSGWGTLLTGGVIVVTLLPISFYFFKYGVWVDLALPLLGMQLHQLVAAKEEDLALKRRLEKMVKET